jgi:serine/threonine/tyrosine-interacting protein
MVVKHSNSTDYDSNQFGNPAFLEALINDGSVTLTHKMLDWRYDKRREAQMVLPFLYIGPLATAKNEKYVRETGFTFLVSVRSIASGPTRAMDATRMAAQCGMPSYNLDIDSPTDLVRKFPAAIKSINDHLEDKANRNLFHENLQPIPIRGKVLVFCETGNDRSAAFVAAYLMAVFNIDVITAVQTVQSQRFSVSIDDSTKNALGTFETLLSAKRDVGRANRHSNQDPVRGNSRTQTYMASAVPARSKRPLDSVYDDDDSMQLHDRQPGQEQKGRIQAAPFQDMEA